MVMSDWGQFALENTKASKRSEHFPWRLNLPLPANTYPGISVTLYPTRNFYSSLIWQLVNASNPPPPTSLTINISSSHNGNSFPKKGMARPNPRPYRTRNSRETHKNQTVHSLPIPDYIPSSFTKKLTSSNLKIDNISKTSFPSINPASPHSAALTWKSIRNPVTKSQRWWGQPWSL